MSYPGNYPGRAAPPPHGYQQPPPGQYQPPPGQYQPPPPQGYHQPPPGQYAPPPGQYVPPPGHYAPPPGQYHQPPPPGHYGPPPPSQYQQPPPGQYAPPGPPPPGQPAGRTFAPPPGPPPPGPSAPGQPGQPGAPPVWQAPPQGYMQQYAGYFSTCTGNKKALLIGINYFGTSSALAGCINDAQNMRRFLTTRYGFRDDPNHIVMLTDDQQNPVFRPTKQNILNAIQWLVAGSRPGDSLFFHFSGHGSQQADKDGDEEDGFDETICPLDFKTAGQIVDDDLNNMLVKPLPHGVRLTAVFDCCHSGSALDLPFTYLPDGTLKQSNKLATLGGLAGASAISYVKGDVMGVAKNLMAGLRQLTAREQSIEEKVAAKGSQVADVICFSGSKDKQTAADAHIDGSATGAMSYALLTALTQTPNCSYGMLLQNVRNILVSKYSQVPQLSTARYMDMNQQFIM
ncbi:caspase domain-containing protein [Entophlyctis helioformis]|nr:caspase domain-containing protein [Entophlyctis helioformis]